MFVGHVALVTQVIVITVSTPPVLTEQSFHFTHVAREFLVTHT